MSEERKDSSISLPDIPKEKEYEDYIAAILQSGGYYLERGVINRIKCDVLELDIVTTKYYEDHYERTISEIKSGKWGLSDVFKVKGWMDYLDFKKASFVVQKPNEHMDISRQVADVLGVSLVNNENVDNSELYSAYSISSETIKKDIVDSFRYAYALESEMILLLHAKAKGEQNKEGFKKLEKYLFEINSNSFFEPQPIGRINKLFASYIKHKNITARIATELENGTYPSSGDGVQLNERQFNELFYSADKLSVLHTSLYAELLARIAILKASVEDIIIGTSQDTLEEKLKRFILPENIRSAILALKKEQYSYLYPYFWQVFVYLFGGFILNDKQKEEYELLSTITTIPVNEIPNAFAAFDKLFPLDGGKAWMFNHPTSNIQMMHFFPTPLRGIGANFRRICYRTGETDSYSNLSSQLSGSYTLKDIIKWNNLAYEYLSQNKRKKNP